MSSLHYIPNLCVPGCRKCTVSDSPSPGAKCVLAMIRPVFIVNPCGALSLVPRNGAFLSLVTTILHRGGWTHPETHYVSHAVNLITRVMHVRPRDLMNANGLQKK